MVNSLAEFRYRGKTDPSIFIAKNEIIFVLINSSKRIISTITS